MRKAIKSGAIDPPPDKRFTRGASFKGCPKKEDVQEFFLWLYTDWAEPMATIDIDGHTKERGQVTEKKLVEIRQLLNATSDLTRADLERLGPRHMDRMGIAQMQEMHAAWTSLNPVSTETIRLAFKNWSCVLRPRTRECTHRPCERCAELKLMRKRATDRKELRAIADELARHRDDVFADRRVYKHYSVMSERATMNAQGVQGADTSVLSIIIDGMDQSKFLCPRNLQASKLWDRVWRPQLGFIGALVHGVCECYYILEPGLQKSGSTIVEVLALVLEKVADILAQRGVLMPKRIMVQLDNTSRENKNVTVLRFLNYLSEVFVSTGLHFFMVGHTHTDVDQRFSVVGPVIAEATELETPADFAAVIRRRYKPLDGHELHVQVLEAIRNWKAWLINYGEVLGGHTGKGSAHAFKFVRYKNLYPSWHDMTFDSISGLDQPQAEDRLLLVKGFMRDNCPLQNPLIVLRGDHVRLDPSHLEVQDMKAGGGRDVAEYRKTAAVLACDPWNLTRASAWLQRVCQRWEENTSGALQPVTFVFEARDPYNQPLSLEDWCEPVDMRCKPVTLKPQAKPKAAVAPKAKPTAVDDRHAQNEEVVPPPVKRTRVRKPDPPVQLGCSKCRKCKVGCAVCRRSARVEFSPIRGWRFI